MYNLCVENIVVPFGGGDVRRLKAADGMCGVRFLLWLLALLGWVTASEFPERECCDLEYPPQSTAPSSSVATSTAAGMS